jgi:ribosome-associated translation inhibitor RaiA
MNIRFRYQDVNQEDKEKLEKYFDDRKLLRLTKLIQPKDLELANLDLNAKYHQHNSIFLVKLVLEISGRNLRAEDSGKFLTEAFDLAFDTLVDQLRKLEDKRTDK